MSLADEARHVSETTRFSLPPERLSGWVFLARLRAEHQGVTLTDEDCADILGAAVLTATATGAPLHEGWSVVSAAVIRLKAMGANGAT
jgi:hypothetical protein